MNNIKSATFLIPLSLSLALLTGCAGLPGSSGTQGAVVGGVSGAAIGSAVGGGTLGTVVGGVVGAGVGHEVGKNRRKR